ncbi:SDR family NAD(P)-dependent oxidoreductase [Pseudoduganella sp. S-14]|uniref:SDR family NAD(P)-dependent oxidoreductase n=1 Tax=Pseudoduganella sp. S-14 TaxID=3404065 RepID=UPI003CE9B641
MITDSKIAVITGASSGIGAAYAERFARRGYDLVLVARRAERLQSLAASLTDQYGVRVESLVADLASEEGQARVEQRLASSPAVSVLVNNAGIARLATISTSPLQDSLAQIALNMTALTRLTHAILPGMLARNTGSIINISSVMALNTLPISSVYSGSKAFVLAFSRGLQQELADTGVKVQVVLPAATATEIWDQSGVPFAALPPEAVMTTDNLVDAALAAFDQGETVTLPSVAELGMIDNFESSRIALFGAAQTGKVAPRLQSR